MSRKGTTTLISFFLLGILSFGLGNYLMSSSSNIVQTNPSYSNNFNLPNYAAALQTKKVSGDGNLVGSYSSSPISSVSLSAGVSIEPNGTTKCILISGFDSTSCVSTSRGEWKNAVLTIEISPSESPSIISSVNISNNNVVIVSSWSVSPFSQTTLFQGSNPTNVVQESEGYGGLNLYPVSNNTIVINEGQIYNYSIALADGHILSGSVVAE